MDLMYIIVKKKTNQMQIIIFKNYIKNKKEMEKSLKDLKVTERHNILNTGKPYDKGSKPNNMETEEEKEANDDFIEPNLRDSENVTEVKEQKMVILQDQMVY